MHAARELATLVGIHGLVQEEQHQVLEVFVALEQDTTINNAEPSSFGVYSVLQECVLPLFDAAADGATLEAAAADLAVGPTANNREPGVVMQRAELSMAASLAYAAKGAVVQALYCAGEGHRLLGSLVQSGDDGSTAGAASQFSNSNGSISSSSGTSSDTLGWWKLSVTYCRSLLLVGRLFESAGMMDEAIVALKEGQRMVSSLVFFYFTVNICSILIIYDVYCLA